MNRLLCTGNLTESAGLRWCRVPATVHLLAMHCAHLSFEAVLEAELVVGVASICHLLRVNCHTGRPLVTVLRKGRVVRSLVVLLNSTALLLLVQAEVVCAQSLLQI